MPGGLTYWEVTSNHGVGIFLSYDIDTKKFSSDVIQQYFRPSRVIAVTFACYLVYRILGVYIFYTRLLRCGRFALERCPW